MTGTDAGIFDRGVLDVLVFRCELEPPLSGPLSDQQKCPPRRAARIRNVMWSLRPMGRF